MVRKYNISKEELEKYYYSDNKTMKEISYIFGCSPMCIVSLMKKYGLKKKLIQISKETLEDLYWKQNKSVRQCAKILGCGQGTVNLKMREYGIARRPNNKFVDITKKELFDLYWNKKLNVHQIAKVIRCQAHTVCRKLNEFGIKVRTKSEIGIMVRDTGKLPFGKDNGCYRKDLDREEELKDLYLNKKLSGPKIAKLFNCSDTCILKRLRKFNIPVRKNKEANKLVNKYGKNNPMFGIRIYGEDAPRYVDGRTPLCRLIRNLLEYTQWKKQVLERDNNTCKECGDYFLGNMEVHHIKPFAVIVSEFLKYYDNFSPVDDKEILSRLAIKYEPFWDINNGETLCEYCHDLKRKETVSKIKKRYGE
jgi:5-methylcytosine-specific restriction endonuclease McrA/DNA-binding CsgD family transcriptional regulator